MTVNYRMIAAGLLVAGLSGASFSPAEAASKKVALLMGPTQDAFIGTWVKSFEAALRGKGVELSTFASPYDPALQARQLDDAIAQKFDALVVQTLSQRAIVPALTRAKNAGVPVVTVISLMSDDSKDLSVAYVGEDSRQLGARAGEAMAAALKAAGRTDARVAAVTGTLAEGIAPLRMDGFRDAMARLAPQAKIVAVEDAKWNPVAAEQAAGQLLARFSAAGGLDAMYGMNDRLANSIIQAATTSGRKVGTGSGELIVIGGNCQGPGIQNLKAGSMAATVRMLPTVSADRAAEVVEKVLAGGKVEKTNFEDHVIVTPENVAEHAQACSY